MKSFAEYRFFIQTLDCIMGCMCAHVTQHSKYIQKINSIFFKLRRSTGCQIGSAPSAATNSYQRIHCTLQSSNFIVHCSLRNTCIMLKTCCKGRGQRKKTFSFGHCPNDEGRGSTRARIFWPSF